MKIKKLREKRLIKPRRPDFAQIGKWLIKAKESLRLAKNILSQNPSWAFTISYQAMLLAGRALMFSFGYLPSDGGQHLTTVEFAKEILGREFKRVTAEFERMREMRNEFFYGSRLEMSKYETKNALVAAEKFINEIARIVEKKNPQKKLL